jgi:hypothetical protein
MKKPDEQKIEKKLWQRLSAQFLLCAIIFVSTVKKSFGQIAFPTDSLPLAGVYTPTYADIFENIAKILLIAVFSAGIIFYLIIYYFGYKNNDIEKRNKRFKILTSILAAIVTICTLFIIFHETIFDYIKIY